MAEEPISPSEAAIALSDVPRFYSPKPEGPAEPSTYGDSLPSLDPEPAPETEYFSSDVEGLRKAAEERLNNAERNEVVARHFADPENPEKIADGERPVSVKHASESLTAVREEERIAAEKALDAEMAAAIDAHRVAPAEAPADQPNHDIQPETAPEAPPSSKLAAALQDPQFRAEFEQQFGQTVAQVEQARQAYHDGVTQAQHMALTAVFDAHPDLIGLNAEELGVALKMKAKTDPSILSLVGKAQAVHNVAQQARQSERQLMAEQTDQYCRAEDAKFEQLIANDPDAKAVKDNGYRIMKEYYGASKEEVDRTFANPSMRNAIVQKMAYDNIKARLVEERTKAALKNNLHRPIPHVQRPGVSTPIARDHGEVSDLNARLNLAVNANPGSKESRVLAAQLIAARRRAS